MTDTIFTNLAATLTTKPAKPAKAGRAIETSVPSDKVYIDATGIKLARDAYTADGTADKKWIKFADYARSQGVTYSMVIAGGEAREWIQQNIVIPFGLSPEQRAAILAPKAALKGWTDEQKKFRRVNCQQAIGSKLGKIACYLMTEADKTVADAKQSKADTGDTDTGDTDTEAKKVAPLADTLKKDLAAMIVRIQKAEDAEGFDAGKLCKALTAAIALIR